MDAGAAIDRHAADYTTFRHRTGAEPSKRTTQSCPGVLPRHASALELARTFVSDGVPGAAIISTAGHPKQMPACGFGRAAELYPALPYTLLTS